jgi:hypothetical protein
MAPKKQAQQQSEPEPEQQDATPPGPADPGEVRPFEGEPALVQEEVQEGPADPGPHATPQDDDET